ncbi:asr1572 [Nostoc sp. PCC 7120 = FACHB-418]|nr:asr1572 [Nostoc sp. PCC 7120 = FACHB-418]
MRVSINTNPYQGLKLRRAILKYPDLKVSINTNPYQGLKRQHNTYHGLNSGFY